MQVVSIVGARPQFVKAAAVSRVLGARHREVLVHTGQHYEPGLSQVFFDELGIPAPDVNLAVGSASHGRQTAAMLAGIEDVILDRSPDWVLVYGDTNSTLAGALAAAKLRVPLAHVEAGLRSHNRGMAEEINRVLTDRVSDLLFCPSDTARANLAREGIDTGVEIVGDVMADALAWALQRLEQRTPACRRFGLPPGAYLLATVHRAENTDRPERLRGILDALRSAPDPVVFPVHPRTREALARHAIATGGSLQAVEPLGHFDLISLAQHARAILTDSGGLQKEAYWLGVPCITLRDETEWVETVAAGWNRLAGADPPRIVDAVNTISRPETHPPLYGDGRAAERVVEALERVREARVGERRHP
jgi:UDP-N-acetylglucosamine 2-epimerase